MTPEKVKQAVKLLGGLFPGQITQEQAKFLGGELAGFSFEAVEKAIRAHRGAHEFLTYPQLLEGCRAADREATSCTDATRREGTWCQVFRRQNHALVAAGDVEVILRVHRNWWHKCPQNAGWRNKLTSSCRFRLFAAESTRVGREMNPEETNGVIAWAAQTAELVFADVATVDMALQELRGNLAVA